jgi:hypothetical protein
VDRLDDAARRTKDDAAHRQARRHRPHRRSSRRDPQRSRYAGLPFDRRVARSLVMQAIQRNMGEHDGGCLVVVEEVDGNVEAFIIGTLSRVYMVVDALKATDLFLVAGPKATLLAARKLLGAYIAWAERNPAVYEIELTHTDVTPQSAAWATSIQQWASSPSATPIAGPTRRSRPRKEAA